MTKELFEEPQKIERSDKEIEALKSKLHFLAKVLVKNHKVNLEVGKGWSASLSKRFKEERTAHPEKSVEEFNPELLIPETITCDGDDLKNKSEEAIFGLLRHEIGHIRHSDYQSLIEMQDEVARQGFSAQDIACVFNGYEDGRSNAREAEDSLVAKHRLSAYLKEHLLHNLSKDLKNHSLPVQYSIMCWALGVIDFVPEAKSAIIYQEVDEKVRVAFSESVAIVDQYLKAKNGRRAFKEIFWPKAWPIFKKLVKNYLEEEAKKMSQDFVSNWSEVDNQDKPAAEALAQGVIVLDWDKLSNETKEKFKQKAREKLDEEEKEISKMLMPQTMELVENSDGTIEIVFKPTTESIDETPDSANIAVPENLDEKLKVMKEEQSGMSEKEKNNYKHYLDPVQKYVSLLTQKLDEIFPPQEEGGWEAGHNRGKRIRGKDLAREIPIGRGNVFEQKQAPEISELAFTLLIDISGSMNGEKIEKAIQAAVLMAEAFSKKGLPFEIYVFGATLRCIKNFDEPYSGRIKVEVAELPQSLEGSTDTGFAVDFTAKKLQKRFMEHNAKGSLIVVTDGDPWPIPEHSSDEFNLFYINLKWSNRLSLLGLGLGEETRDMITANFGKNGICVPDINDLPRILLTTLAKQAAKFARKS